MENSSKIIIVAGGIVLLLLIIFANVRKIENVEPDINKNVFQGVITNMKLEPGILEGTGVYDKSCNMIGNGLTNCDAGIQTEKGLLNFNYKHNMDAQPCIAPGDKLKVEVLDSEGNAKVTRQ